MHSIISCTEPARQEKNLEKLCLDHEILQTHLIRDLKTHIKKVLSTNFYRNINLDMAEM